MHPLAHNNRKRRLTNDFATVVWRLKLLGFNAVRLPFTFSALADDLAEHSKFYACVVSWLALGELPSLQLYGTVAGRGCTVHTLHVALLCSPHPFPLSLSFLNPERA